MSYGKYNYKVITLTLYFENLPNAFDGFRLTHISDIHVGSLNDDKQLKNAIQLINEQSSDILVFTGDIVNSHANEMNRWLPIFKEIRKHKYGMYSVLGNHDYGEYIKWPNEQAKTDNFNGILDIHKKLDFSLLRNQSQVINIGKDSLWIVGVENWGHNFKKAGDLEK
ncbi:metallophosphoesterase, partial [Arthrospira platensis SPKY1]|nr:metallophosphoesterase [Arthrospira platensis SPKY1]